MAPPATPTIIPTGGDFLGPKFDVELIELLNGTLEDAEEEDVAF
jgi:hypothetical protein